jgi:single-stranded-DNA-specific exonuclease
MRPLGDAVRLKGFERDWVVADAMPIDACDSLARALGVPRIAAEVLMRRGVTDPADANLFLDPRLKALRDPFLMPDMARAAERAWEAIDRRESILIHGDYDVDGIVGTAFLIRMLRRMGARVAYFLPDRLKDGYGISNAGLEAAGAAGATLIVAVDCGITANQAAEAASSRGIDLVILDHHQPPPVLPRAVAVVDTLREDATYPFHGLCGVGVAAKFIQAMAMMRRGRLDPKIYVDALQLVALGTIADVVPLVDENRTFVVHGLRSLAHSSWPGILALKRLARLGGHVNATQVAFQLAPRLNATGRMGCASLGVELLLAETAERGELLARAVEEQNLLRRESDQAVTASARAMVEALPELPPILVLWSGDWPAGVIGIAAARISEEFRRPTLLIGMIGEVGRGSARSPGKLDIGRAFAQVGDILLAHGGHSQAAGLTVHNDRLHDLRERLHLLAASCEEEQGHGALTLDGELQPDDLEGPLLDFLGRLAPFGAGSPEPLFLVRDLQVVGSPRIVGRDHLRLTVTHGSRRMTAIGFGLGRHLEKITRLERRATLAATPAADEYRGEGAIQLRFKDVQV